MGEGLIYWYGTRQTGFYRVNLELIRQFQVAVALNKLIIIVFEDEAHDRINIQIRLSNFVDDNSVLIQSKYTLVINCSNFEFIRLAFVVDFFHSVKGVLLHLGKKLCQMKGV